MSLIEYCDLLYEVSENIDWLTERRRLLFIFKAFLPEGSENNIQDALSLLIKLGEEKHLGIDCLELLKQLLQGKENYRNLLEKVETFETKRRDYLYNEYRGLLEPISRELDECNQLERLISICEGKIAHDRVGDIKDVCTLFTELERQNNLGIKRLDIMKTMVIGMEKPDLLKLVEDFEKRRKQEEDGKSRRAQAVAVLSCARDAGERLIGIVTPHCTFRNAAGAVVAVTTWMILRRSSNLQEFVSTFTETVLPAANTLRAISEGSLCFTVQAENISALEALWESYQDGTLQRNLQEFLVTEEIKQLADSGDVMVTVHIDDQEYKNAILDLMITETQVNQPSETRLNLQRQLREMEEQLTNIQRQLREKEVREVNFHGQLTEKDQQLENAQRQLREKEQQQENAQRQLREMEQQLTNFQGQLREKELHEVNLHEQLGEKEQQQENEQRQLREMEQQLTNFQGQLREKELHEVNLHEQLREKEQQQENEERQLREREQQLTNLQGQFTQKEEETTSFEGQLRTKDQEVNELEITLSTAQQALNDQQRQQSPDWVIPRDQIQLTEKFLGRGAWGNVVEGKYGGSTVAVKQIYELILSPHNRSMFEREMDIASRCRHPCLLQFIGATNDEESPLFVTELMETSLRELLKQGPLSATEVSIISLDVARALNYLHQKKPSPIIHRDISSANVLLWRQGDQWRGKVSDYGTANFMQQTMTVAPGARIYSAPEALTARNQTVKIDVYSFGALLCEVCIRELPDPERRDQQVAMVTNRLLRALIRECLQSERETRPAMEEIVEELQDLQESS